MCPINVTTGDVARPLESYKGLGWEVFATSPFHRGWELDRMVQQAVSLGHGDAAALRAKLADLMLRYTLFHPHVDRVVVAMRKPEWITSNIASVRRGPLGPDELAWLKRLRPRKGWRARLLGRLAPGRR